MNVVTAENLTKIYPSGKKALNGVNLSIEQGEIFGFLGPNGAGKTTAVKLLNGMLTPTEGTCSIHDIDPAVSPEKVHAICGVVTEHAQMYNNLTGLENLLFFGSIFGIGETETKRRAFEILEHIDLLDARNQKLGEYSTGMRQRLSLARAMLHNPKVLFLDEPTSGLDPESAQSVNNLIKSLSQETGTTVFLCTHQLRYAQEICTKYGLISEGSLIATGELKELNSLVFSGVTALIKADNYPPDLKIHPHGEYMSVNVSSYEEIPFLVRRIVDYGGNVFHVEERKPSLEEIYFALIEKRGAKNDK
ncbi:MAG: ABC transporter ATP-binding protein [Treponema sp.]|nr:ABC transporter ATP-binding protein [Treponema sp.]MCL2236957.1 ABC transporter ATP-binding protein [Treponema sp.]